MKIIKPSFEILTKIDSAQILEMIELCGRTCYLTEPKGDSEDFILKRIKEEHNSILEHWSITIRFICDRGVSHEIVRHRIASYSQESTRYCNYSQDRFDNEITVIRPFFWSMDKDSYCILPNKRYEVWRQSMKECEDAYMRLIALGATAQQARSVLPNSLKTTLIMTANLREWRHFLKVRTSPKAHPQMRELTIPLLKEFKVRIPVIFDDIKGMEKEAFYW